MFSYNNEEKYATGLVKPKTTSIFFDKILVTDDLLDDNLSGLGYTDIPNEVLLQPNVPLNQRFIIAHEAAHYLFDMDLSRHLDNNSYDLLNEHNQMYKYSTHRNHGIYEIIEFYRNYGINIIPIYFSPTDYEQHFLPNNSDNEFLSPTISICINKIPEIIEDKLSWEQVLDIRKDKKSLTKIRRFKNWTTLELANKSEEEIASILEKNLDDYSFALKKHGVETAIGAISTVHSVSSTIITALTENANFLMPGITISAGITLFAAKSFIDTIEAKRHPIAIIYDLVKQNK